MWVFGPSVCLSIPSNFWNSQYIFIKIVTVNIILPVVLCGCKNWYLLLRRERRPRVFENRVLRKIFGPKWEEVTGNWKRLRKEELHKLSSSPNIIWVIKSRRVRWTEHVARIRDRRGAYRVLVGRPEGKRPFGRHRHRWDYIKMYFQKVGCKAWTGLIWLRIGAGGGCLCMH